MDKHSYETYEFLATTNPNADTNQFYVLQDDGTILTVNKEIQYITQIEDEDAVGNLNSDQCAAVFDVSSQQYYVDGNEGVGVENAGSGVKTLSQGLKVVVTKPALGTWRNYGVFHQEALKVVPDDLELVEAATITVNPCTAYRMLTDLKPVREKSLVVIQNVGNSVCGQNVIQLCKVFTM